MDAAEGLIKGWGEDGEGISEAYYYVTDAAQLENVIREVQSISSINWNNYKITANNEVYQNISSALSDTGTLITTLIVVITAVSMVLIKPPFTYHKKFSYLLAISGAKVRKNFSPVGNIFAV